LQPRVKNLLSFPSSKTESFPLCADERRRDSEMQASFKNTPQEGKTVTNPIAHRLPMFRRFKSPHQHSCQFSNSRGLSVAEQPKTVSSASILINE